MSAPPTLRETSLLSTAWLQVRAMFDLVLDFSFKTFVTPRLIKTVYALSLVAALLSAIAWMFSGFSVGLTYGVFTLVTGPLAFLIYVLIARVGMEVVLAIFKIADHLEKISERDSIEKSRR